MPKRAATTLTAEERVILVCTATGISHVAVGITTHAMQAIAIKGSLSTIARAELTHSRTAGAPALVAMLDDAGLR